MLHSFGGSIKKTQYYLKNKNMWKPRFIKEDIDIKKREKYRLSKAVILEENLADLKSFCDQEGVIMIVGNYPHLRLRGLNNILGRIVSKLNIVYVNHYEYFGKNISYEEWNKIMTLGHVNYKGHEYMANNLTNILSNIISRLLKS